MAKRPRRPLYIMSSGKVNRVRRSNIHSRHVQSADIRENSSRNKQNRSAVSYPIDRSRNNFSQHSTTYNRDNLTPEHIYFVGRNSVPPENSYLFQNRLMIPQVNGNNSLTSPMRKQRRRPWFIWIISITQLCVFIVEVIYNWVLTTRPIETDLSKNPLFGPAAYTLIHIGASFSPCMHTIDGITNNLSSRIFPCPNSAVLTNSGCTLSDLCGFNGISGTPNQWFRFIIPIFLHVGIIHITLNILGQLLIAVKVERNIGIIRTAIIYFASGIFGFILGGNFAPNGLARAGCSGSLFGIIALSLLSLFYNWKKMIRPKIQLVVHLIDITFSFVLGLLPGVDNFSHIGGFSMGLLLGLAILGSPIHLQRRHIQKGSRRARNEWLSLRCHEKFFYNRPTSWWIWWIVRFVALVVSITLFVLFAESFYSGRIKCSGCKYMSCLPVNGWCDMGTITITKKT